MAVADQVVREAAARLRDSYPVTDLGNKPDPLDELVYILVSGKTAEGTYQPTFDRLKSRFSEWSEVLDVNEAELVGILAPAGLSVKKALWLRRAVSVIEQRFGTISLDHLHGMSDEEAEDFLTSLPGVGVKTARCVLMYSLGRAVFPVDAHTARIFKRLGWSRHHRITDRVQDRMQSIVPAELRYSLHVNCIQHGRAVCVAGRPRCDACVLLDLCPTGREVTSPQQRSVRASARTPRSAP